MSVVFKRRRLKKQKNFVFECFGCGSFFKRRASLSRHQRFAWPGCSVSRSVDKSFVPLM